VLNSQMVQTGFVSPRCVDGVTTPYGSRAEGESPDAGVSSAPLRCVYACCSCATPLVSKWLK
jgi:hypothetical protein